MRRFAIILTAVVAGVLSAGIGSAIGASNIVVEETIVVGERTVKARSVNEVGTPDDFRAGDRYLFRSELTDANAMVVGHLNTDCVVHFGKRDTCTVIYELAPRGTIVAIGQVPVSQLVVGGTWTYAITGGTGEFENVLGSVRVEIVDDTGNSQHTLHLLP